MRFLYLVAQKWAFFRYNYHMAKISTPSPLKGTTMSNALLTAILTLPVSSIRCIVGSLDAKAIHGVARALLQIGDKMPLEQYIQYDIESKLQELEFVATL